MTDFLKELFDNVECYENIRLSYKEANAVNKNIFERIKKEYGDSKPVRAIIKQLEKSTLLMLKEAKLNHDLENEKMGCLKGVFYAPMLKYISFFDAVKAYKKVCENGTPVKDGKGNTVSCLVFCYPSQTLSKVGRKYVYLRNTNGDLAKYVIETGEILAE